LASITTASCSITGDFPRPGKTVDEYAILLNSLLYIEKIRLGEIHSAIVSCVVPPLLIPFEIVCRKYIGIMPIVVEPGIKTGMPVLYENAAELGADRIVNAVAGYDKYKKALIIVDFGTATTFDYITPKGSTRGFHRPGYPHIPRRLFRTGVQAPRVELVQPKTLISKNTVQAMQAGITYGYVSLVDGIVKRMKEEVRTDPLVIATGGLSSLIYKGSETIDVVDEFLTLEGLKILYEKNKDHHKFK
jgi:type III pantothenate kinase